LRNLVPLHIGHMPEAMRPRSQEPPPTLKQIEAALGVSYMTTKRRLGYAPLMRQLGLTEPFRELRDEPESASRWRDSP
jgi:hypothetical protein